MIAEEIDVAIPADGFVDDSTLNGQRIVDGIASANFFEFLFVVAFFPDVDIDAYALGLLLHKLLDDNRVVIEFDDGASKNYGMPGIGDVGEERLLKVVSI